MPVGALSDDLLRARLDQSRLVQAKRPEAHRILVIVFPPFVVGQPANDLEDTVIRLGKAVVDQLTSHPFGLGRAEIGGLENGAQHPLGRDRIFPDVVSVAIQQAAEILRPGPIDGAIDNLVADLPGPQFLRLGRKAENASALPSTKRSMALRPGGDGAQFMSLPGSMPTCAAIAATNR